MPCQVRQGKRQRPGLAFVKNNYPRPGRRGFSFGKDIMETNTFEYIWSLLNPQGEYKRRRQACERLWQGYDDNKQRNIYIRIKAKLRQGEFVNPNPYFAIEDNALGSAAKALPVAQPTNYYGRALPRGVTFYKAVYNGEVGLYSEQDVKAHKMQNAEMFVSA